MAPPTATTPQAWDVYVQEMKGLGYGYPMWFPGPDPTYGNIKLGDIGFIEKGRFRCLFNCMHPEGDASHGNRGERLPEPFVPFKFAAPLDEKRYRRGPDLAISQRTLTGITKRQLKTPGEGSTQATPTGATSVEETSVASLSLNSPALRTFLDCRGLIEEYMDKHGDTWLEFFQQENIVFVYGHTMTAACKVSAWVPSPREDATTTSASSSAVVASMKAMIHMGPDPTPTHLVAQEHPSDQNTIFLDCHFHPKKTTKRASGKTLERLISPVIKPAHASEKGKGAAQGTASSTRPAKSTPSSQKGAT
ncbi:hypothetical protein K466DRAFT_563648 [Polyporus arcularius HHB13444]|uniref:Uncharacterized protein n=1 Tax=Polyporus arcularius HHB13444 TaxID=1314778 RepID=A0A5C3PW18_9APHY|nr:hypothetical protein K466DRAFT_563648 [Polyporus arcularius HHB13444]